MINPHCLPVAAFLLSSAVLAGEPSAPDLTRGDRPDKTHDWTLGPTGARGWIWGRDLETTEARQILITEVEAGSPADGVLEVGDVILGVAGKPFDQDARKVFGRAITEAETTEKKGLLTLLRWRTGVRSEVTVPLEVLGSYGDGAPYDCPKSSRIVEKACRYLADRKLEKDIPGAIGALALLATGKPEHLEKVKALAHEFGPADLRLRLETGMYAWEWGYAALFLAEYHLATGDPAVLPAIRKYSVMMARGQSAVGTWGHGMALPPDRGRLGGYGAINQAGLPCWLSMVLAGKCGIEDTVVRRAVDRSREFFSFYRGKGSIPYGDHPAWVENHDNNGKNALVAVAFDLLDDGITTRYFSRMSAASYDEREYGHTGNWFSYLWGPLGVARAGPEAVAAHLAEQRWYYDLARRWDGGFVYQGGAGAGDSYEGWDMTGVFLLTYALPLEKLHITGRGAREANRLTGADLASVIEDGRGYRYRRSRECYEPKGAEELLERLSSWSPVVRFRASVALATKEGDFVPALARMLVSEDPAARYGACQALEHLKVGAGPVVDSLIGLLEEKDLWLRIRASYALAAIGAPARKAATRLLELALAEDPGDPRGMLRRYLCLALFVNGYAENAPQRGLLADSLDGVDRGLLFPAIRRMLEVEDGLARSYLASVYDKLTKEELEPLWPAILRSVERPALSGEMFENEIRLAGLRLLSRHRIREGIRIAVEYARTQNAWGSESRTGEILATLGAYGTAAREVLPALRELLAYCRDERDFPDDCKKQKIAAVERAIRAIEAATESPPLRAVRYRGWRHSGSLWITTTPDGADLPATAAEEGFPALVRLHRDTFDFGQARPRGEDIRFSTAEGSPLAFQIDDWDPVGGTASIWVRIPAIRGDARQEIKLHWGNADAESCGPAVFDGSNGFLGVWHLTDPARDEVGTLTSTDVGTADSPGAIGRARRFGPGRGIRCGEGIVGYPSGDAPSTTSAWFRAEGVNADIVAWGNEGGGSGSKVRMRFASPPRVVVDSDFADVAGATRLPVGEWIHVVHTYRKDDSRIYVNGRLDGATTPRFSIKDTVRMWIGGWYDGYSFDGDIDEVRVSGVARSADWIRLEHENQKPHQTLVGPLVQAGDDFSVTPAAISIPEGASATLSARAGGAEKIYWILLRDGAETVVAADRLTFTLDAGRVTADATFALRFKAVCSGRARTRDVPVTIREAIPEPAFTLEAPPTWNGRDPVEVVPAIRNLAEMEAKGAGDLRYDWTISGGAVIREVAPGKLILRRSQCGGEIVVGLALSNGGAGTAASVSIAVTEPDHDPWVHRAPDADEKPEDDAFYARDDAGECAVHWNGTLDREVDSVFLRIRAGDRPYAAESRKPSPDGTYALSARIAAGLVRYRAELGTRTGDRETVLHEAVNLVCGDAYLIDGQSNAEATDVGDEDPPFSSDWIRSFGSMTGDPAGARGRLWGNAVCRDRHGAKLQIGYWGLELARRLVESQGIPICILNGAVGGSRIDVHQRNPEDPEDPETIYGRLLWRVRQARLTHGIRGVLWHQGENDQGADGPTGRFGWETYRQYFVDLSAAWKEDYPNLRGYYVFQIWPKACSMGFNGSDDMLREVQRTLPSWYSNLSIMSTLGIDPPGGCHFPVAGYAEFARLICPLVERDVYGAMFPDSVTPPNLVAARYTSARQDGIVLEFDQPVAWRDALTSELYLDGAKGLVASGSASGNAVVLELKGPSTATAITYLEGRSWSPDNILRGRNGIAALTFCAVPIGGPPAESSR